MIITCEECNTSFNLNESLLKKTGSKVRCSKCQHIFVAYPAPPVSTAKTGDDTETAKDFPMAPANRDLASRYDEETQRDDSFPEEEAKGETEIEFASEEIDISDIENALEVEDNSPPTQVAGTEKEDLELDLDLDIAPETANQTAEDPLDDALAIDDLDLSDLENTVDSGDAATPDKAVTTELEDLELDLDMDTAPETANQTAVPASDSQEEPEEFDLSNIEKMLDMEDVATPDEPTTPAFDSEEEAEELDLSDIEKMLDIEDVTEQDAADDDKLEDLELELELDMASVAEEGRENDSPLDPEELESELDFSDIEAMLQVEEETEEKTTEPAPDELDLNLDSQPPRAESDEDPSATRKDIDASEPGLSETGESSSGRDTAAPLESSAGEDIALEFDLLDTDQNEIDAADDRDKEAAAGDRHQEAPQSESKREELQTPAAEIEETAASSDDGKETPKPARKKRITAIALVLLIGAMLVGGTIFILDRMGKKVPFVSDLLTPKVQDAGNLKIKAYDINGRFVENAKAGRLFVISGKVKNQYPESRSFISVEGEIYTKADKSAKAENVYCGNVLSDPELKSLDFNTIKKRLSKRTGDNSSNVKVNPGQALPFMIVFSDLPQNLERYTIQALQSIKG